jgi:c(7)-type cytochrome triheme protein
VQWLDCNNCHPDNFNIKKKTTKHFSMERILKREFCGVCHLTVAFPMDDCKRCYT